MVKIRYIPTTDQKRVEQTRCIMYGMITADNEQIPYQYQKKAYPQIIVDIKSCKIQADNIHF